MMGAQNESGGASRLMLMLAYLIIVNCSASWALAISGENQNSQQNNQKDNEQAHSNNHHQQRNQTNFNRTYQRLHSAYEEIQTHQLEASGHARPNKRTSFAPSTPSNQQPQQQQQQPLRRAQLPNEQKLALQIFIADPTPNKSERDGLKKANVQVHKYHPNLLVSGRKRPYDVIRQENQARLSPQVSLSHLDRYSPLEKHFYQLEPLANGGSQTTVEADDRSSTTSKRFASGSSSTTTNSPASSASSSSSSTTTSTTTVAPPTRNATHVLLFDRDESAGPSEESAVGNLVVSGSGKRKKPKPGKQKPPINSVHGSEQKVELVRTQHSQPVWPRKKPPPQQLHYNQLHDLYNRIVQLHQQPVSQQQRQQYQVVQLQAEPEKVSSTSSQQQQQQQQQHHYHHHHHHHHVQDSPASVQFLTNEQDSGLNLTDSPTAAQQSLATEYGVGEELIMSLMGRKRPRITTASPTQSSTTTEFFKLLSSAHSPITHVDQEANSMQAFAGPTTSAYSSIESSQDSFLADSTTRRPQLITLADFNLFANQSQSNSSEEKLLHYFPKGGGSRERVKPNQFERASTVSPVLMFAHNDEPRGPNLPARNMSDGRVVSPEIVVAGGSGQEGNSLITTDEAVNEGHMDGRRRVNGGNSGGYIKLAVNSSHHHNRHAPPAHINFSLSPNEVPATVFDGKKKVTIIRHSSTPTKIRLPPAATTSSPTILSLPPERVKLDEMILQPPPAVNVSAMMGDSAPMSVSISGDEPPLLPHQITTGGNQLVRLISKHKSKYDDNITSPTLTVVDNDAFRLPPNATSVHNKLIVAIRPGRPRRYPSTTQFPVYNIVAGITPPAPQAFDPSLPITQRPFQRPNSPEGSVFGLLNTTQSTTPKPSTFGAQNIKFPAQLESAHHVEHVHHIAEKLNISVPDSANHVGPNKVPDKILMETEEQHFKPPDALVISDATIISRPPYGTPVTTNQDGIMKLGTTTRKPTRTMTTKRINIVTTNTTVAHQINQHHNQPVRPSPPKKPSLFTYLANAFNAGLATSIVAILTLLKTIFVAILVMFLPPIALTAAITQAVAMG